MTEILVKHCSLAFTQVFFLFPDLLEWITSLFVKMSGNWDGWLYCSISLLCWVTNLMFQSAIFKLDYLILLMLPSITLTHYTNGPKKPSWNSLKIVDKLKARGTHTPTHGLASTWLVRTAISPGQWQPWTAVLPLLGLISMALPSGFALHRPDSLRGWPGI